MSTATVNPAAVTTWKLDPAHSIAEFKVKHMMISNVKGHFSGLSGDLILHEPEHTLTRVDASIDASTVNTGDAARDEHIKLGDFFDIAQFPAITFKSTKVEPKGGGDFTVTGDLTLRGVTKSVKLAVEGLREPTKDPWGNLRVGLSATTKINRKDFGLTYNAALEAGGILVGEEVSITLEVQFVKA